MMSDPSTLLSRNLKGIGCRLTPYKGVTYDSENGVEVRLAVHCWVRTSGAFDAVVDFEKATQD